jgi:hypothetical protein
MDTLVAIRQQVPTFRFGLSEPGRRSGFPSSAIGDDDYILLKHRFDRIEVEIGVVDDCGQFANSPVWCADNVVFARTPCSLNVVST